MWPSVVVVIVTSYVVSSVVSMPMLEDNDIDSEYFLQDLTSRTKKSPVDDSSDKKIQTTPTDSKSSAELVTLLAQDIKQKVEDLRSFKDAYTKLEDDFLGSAKDSNDSSLEEIETELLAHETSKPVEEKVTIDELSDDDESLRIARQNYGQLTVDDSGRRSVIFDGKTYPVEKLNSPVLNSYYNNEDPYIAQENPYARHVEKGEIQGELHIQPVKIQTITHQPHPLKQIKQLIPGILNALTALVKPFENANPHPTATAVPVIVKPIHAHIKPVVHKKPEAVIHTVATGSKKPGIFFSKQLFFGIGTDDKVDHHQEVHGDVHHEVHGQGHYFFIPVIAANPVLSPSYYPFGSLDSSYIYSSYPGSYSNYGSFYGTGGYGYPDEHYGYGSLYSPSGSFYQQGHSSLEPVHPVSPSAEKEHDPFPSNRNAPGKPYQEQVNNSTTLGDFMGENNQNLDGHNMEIGQLKLDIADEQEKVRKLKEELELKPDSKEKQEVLQGSNEMDKL